MPRRAMCQAHVAPPIAPAAKAKNNINHWMRFMQHLPFCADFVILAVTRFYSPYSMKLEKPRRSVDAGHPTGRTVPPSTGPSNHQPQKNGYARILLGVDESRLWG